MPTVKLVACALVALAVNVGCSSKDHSAPNYDDPGSGSGGSAGNRPVVDAGSEASPDAISNPTDGPDASDTGTAIDAVSPADAVSQDPPDVAPEATVTPQPEAGDVPTPCAEAGACGLTLSAASAIPADGKATTVVNVAFFPSQIGDQVELTIQGRGSWASNKLSKITVALDAAGKGSAVFLSDAAGGSAVITGKRVNHQEIGIATIDMPVLHDITQSAEYAISGVKSSGFQESNLITFSVLSANGLPYPPGLEVQLTHQPLGQSTLDPLPSCNTTGCIITKTAMTDEKGQVTVTLHSGKAAGTAMVAITATAGGQTKVVTASVPVVGAKASGKNVAIDCTPRNVAALADTDCVKSRVDATVECTATLGDRFGNQVGVPTDVAYASEAGLVGPPQKSVGYPDPKIGLAVGSIATLGGGLPLDVTPIEGERSVHFARCNTDEHNPRDGIVTVIATMPGEEGYIDENRDGDYTPGEPFIDLPEPYVDRNDNNTRDVSEDFLDLNNSGSWDGPNGKWDSATTLWVQTRIVYSGEPKALIVNDPVDSFAYDYLSRLNFTPWTVPSKRSVIMDPLHLTYNQVMDLGFFVSDANMNVPAPQTAYNALSSTPAISVTRADPMAAQRTEGFLFVQQFCDGAAPANCGSQCPPTPTTKQCVVKTSLSDFEYGVAGSIHILASTSPGPFNLITTSSVVAGKGSSSPATLLMNLPGDVGP